MELEMSKEHRNSSIEDIMNLQTPPGVTVTVIYKGKRYPKMPIVIASYNDERKRALYEDLLYAYKNKKADEKIVVTAF